MSIPSFLKGSPPTHPNLLQKHPKKGHQNRARDTLIPSTIPFFSLNQSNNAFVFRVYRGITVYYPVMWGSLLNNQYFMESVSGTLFFFFSWQNLDSMPVGSESRSPTLDWARSCGPSCWTPICFLDPGSDQRLDPPNGFGFPFVTWDELRIHRRFV